MTQRSPRADRRAVKAPIGAETPPIQATAPELPPVGRRRGADPQRMIAHLARMCAEKDQQIAAGNALVDELEEALEAEQEASAGLRAELVAATKGDIGEAADG